MKFTVLWKKPAEDALAGIWLAADDRELITRTAFEIDRRLEKEPQSAGESRPDGTRILIRAPLGVKFQVYAEDRIVRVADVWRFRVHR